MVYDDDTGTPVHHVIRSTDRLPKGDSTQLPKSLQEPIAKLARKYSTWGPERIHAELTRRGSEISLDAVKSVLDSVRPAGRQQ
jgi:hypothetical protein